MDISIIMATLNEEKYIRDTLGSIVNQHTDKKFEIILGDGKSTDRTVDIAREFKCKITKVEPGVIAAGREAAAKKATGKVLVSADADAYYPPNWLEELTRPVKGKTVATCGKLLPLNGSRVEKLFAEKVLNPVASFTYQVKIPFAAAMNLAISREAYEKVGGYDSGMHTAEDTDLMRRLMKAGKVVYCPNAICYVSMRRIRKWGYAKYLSFHTANFIKYHVGAKVFEVYEPIR